MLKKRRKRSQKTGLPPGTLVYTGTEEKEEVSIHIIDYNEKDYKILDTKDLNKIEKNEDTSLVRWIDIDGIHQLEIIKRLGSQFNLHPLLLEDIVNPEQRPKIEKFDDYLYVVLKFLRWEKEDAIIHLEQISIILGNNYVISIREQDSGVFEPILERIKTKRGKIREEKSDYLMYALIDVIIDNYFTILEIFGDKIDEIDEELVTNPDQKTLEIIHKIKRDIITIRKFIRPLREVINSIQRSDIKLIKESTGIYFRDIYDHTIQIIDTFESYRDIITTMHDSYLSSVSHRMNEIINLLTIISTIFIPLSFLAGLYGMNFAYMPELQNPYGYFILLIVMVTIGIGMLVYFRKKKWI
ncbi:MAG: magnesium/cobalt transporter CorA [Candidatus Lokiarchaeota archaeon]|nr:magnesium/cobalt transporter CorA [Candidatus Lokiarchaeota archaeon]MBD3343346.1 magnesium/cobalt transporter CorA [Candidatus Lokiarchaeota archaeon]